MGDDVILLRKAFRNRRLLSALESQFSSGTELGVEFIDDYSEGSLETETYRLYTKGKSKDWSRDRFVITRSRKKDRWEYIVKGRFYF